MRTLILLACLVFVSASAQSNKDVSPLEPIEWCDIWISHADETNLPRVLLIGDSITRDYYSQVEKRLAGKAYVARLSTSRFASDPVLLEEVKLVLGQFRFDVIHFNNGMHGWQHSEEDYRKALPQFLGTLQKHAPGARLVAATTTPIKNSTPVQSGEPKPSNERIEKRNEILRSVLAKENVIVNDLYSISLGHPECYRDNVHFNSQGIELQAAQVAGTIQPLIPKPR